MENHLVFSVFAHGCIHQSILGRGRRLTVFDEETRAAKGVAFELALVLRVGEAGLEGLRHGVGLAKGGKSVRLKDVASGSL